MTEHRFSSWWGAALLAVLIGLGTHTMPVAPSPGRWEPNAERASHAESTWVLEYLVAHPRTGDRISTGLYLALAESEDAWVVAYLARQQTALARAAARLDHRAHANEREDLRFVVEALQHYRALVASGQNGANAFALLLDDKIGPQLREEALRKMKIK
jgi:hypothetical protein